MTFKTKILTGLTALVLGLSCGGEEATTPTGCTKDSDCKNNRVCNYETGMCEEAEENNIYFSEDISILDSRYQEKETSNSTKISECTKLIFCIGNKECDTQSCVDSCKDERETSAQIKYDSLDQCVVDNCSFNFYKTMGDGTKWACALEHCWSEYETCIGKPLSTGPLSCSEMITCNDNCTDSDGLDCYHNCKDNMTQKAKIKYLKMSGCGGENACFDSPDYMSCLNTFCKDKLNDCLNDK